LNKYNKYMKKYIIQIKKSYVGYDWIHGCIFFLLFYFFFYIFYKHYKYYSSALK
jgi:hypothetical protein